MSALFERCCKQVCKVTIDVLCSRRRDGSIIDSVFRQLLRSSAMLLPSAIRRCLLADIQGDYLGHVSLGAGQRHVTVLCTDRRRVTTSPRRSRLQLRRVLRFTGARLAPRRRYVFGVQFLKKVGCKRVKRRLNVDHITI